MNRNLALLIIIFMIFFSNLSAGEAKEGDFIFLSDVHGKGTWAKYITDNEDFNWNGQLGIDWDIFRYKESFIYLLINIETIIEGNWDSFRFDPRNVNYTLEPGLRVETKRVNYSLIYHHVCRHDVDRFDASTEKWTVLGFRLESKRYEPEQFGPEIEYLWRPFGEISSGKYLLTTDCTYDWDGIAELGIDILKYKRVIFYLSNKAHLVFQEEARPSGKDYFLDYTFEHGVKIYGGKGRTSLFCQYQHKHDVDKYNGLTEDWGLVGLRYEW